MSIKDCHIKAGMTKEEVNEIISEYVLFEDDIYTGKRYKHNWKCLCGKPLYKTWNAIKGGREGSRGYMCENCSKEITLKNNKIKKEKLLKEREGKTEKCCICGREQKYGTLTKQMCYKHYEQYQKYGHCLDENPRTVYDPNEIVLYDDYAEVLLYNKHNEEVGRFKIDLEDIDIIKEHRWSLDSKGYVRTRGKMSISIHKLIMGGCDEDTIDHINHDRLDNRRCNLRACSFSENDINKSIQINNTSGIAGVYKNEKSGLWCAQIKINNQTIPLGSSSSFEKAIQIRKEAEEKYFGEYSLFNSCEDVLKDLLEVKIGGIYKVILDMRLDFGIITKIIDENICIMRPINFNQISDEEIRVDRRKIKMIEGID